MTDIGTALEKLIEILQLEGHELFEIFVAAQAIAGIAHIIITLIILGGILGGYYFWKFLKRIDFGDTVDRAAFGCLAAIIVGIILLIVSLSIFSGYMHVYYPEYTAATEMLDRLAYSV